MIRFTALLFVSFPLFCNASIPVEGFFDAKKSCPAFISKNKATNPDELTIQAGQRYRLREIINIPPQWVRVEFPSERYALRWIRTECGIAQYEIKQEKPCDNSPGMADSHVLALNWLPGFCETYGYEAGKPECIKLPADAYQAQHMVLHGLWPNNAACGSNYGYCGVEGPKAHCDYPPVILSKPVADDLSQFMPSYAYGSCLERHEWNKHGSCQVLSADQYFSLAMRLTNETNKTAIGQFLQAHIGDVVELSQMKETIKNTFGDDAGDKVYLGCKNGRLVDIYISLPALIPEGESLLVLIQKASNRKYGYGCPQKIIISDFHTNA
ncbi:ribonuclease T2 family protein [Legionella oakridgensis]|uniref:Ribonuclease, T2 family n=1 Tax=Legionella oakridgensis TaxID=29423 RepID=A0A0W0X378_9GAMM|nr:ribonuclease T [Legionella oakridgensis]ETO92236.1 ribonuclease I [Legionella oakridgensis RV-2-2007]KTD39007.1 ribonuclease, T2 family [Legionella oakridgensis]STY21265.1 ribonuclease, T2 family [Legionella longbeachae]